MNAKRILLIVAGVGIACLLAWSGIEAASREDDGKQIYVATAASLGEAMAQLAKDFERTSDYRVRLDVGSSGLLRTKIAAGAEMDLFVSAAARDMDLLAASGHVASETRRDLLRNTLVCVIQASSAHEVNSPTDLLKGPVRRIAIGDPGHVPAGIYAQQALQRLGLSDRLTSKIVPCADALAVVVQVRSRTVDAAVVYASDVRLLTGVKVAFVFPQETHDSIVYPAAVLTASRRPDAAEAFLAYLQTPHAAEVFAEYDFDVARGEVD
ncbi:MAG: molybdate ABC transporter substrate-binding protein [Planctomycetota bacterium]